MKLSLKSLQKRIWVLCKEIIRARYGNTCYVCGRKNLKGSDWHTAHLIPKKACNVYLKYDLRNLRPCCYNCNMNLGGFGALYYRNMVEREGQAYVDKIFEDCTIEVSPKEFYPSLLEQYKLILQNEESLTRF